MALSVVILAAGQGSRMKSSKPKVLHEISGKAMLFFVIDAAKLISDDITVILYHKSDLIREEIEQYYKNISFHIQNAEEFPGTGGAMMGVNIKHDRALILNGDMPLVTKDSLELLASTDESSINMSVLMMDNPTGYGRVIIEDGKVKQIVEEKDCTTEQKKIKTVNAGVYCVSKSILEKFIPKLNNNNAQKEYYLTDIVAMAVADGQTVQAVIVKEEEFKGVNSKLDLANAERIMQNRIKDKLMIQGVTMRLPETIYIDSHASFEGECILENGVSIIGRSHISHSHIKAHTVIEESEITNSDIGPMARIRPASIIEGTHIGNFTEVKKSHLKGVKAGHLSYIGDSEIDEGSNIGAGTITCNYDGKNKYKTVIGKNVFVGSDSQLIAPVNIGDNVIIAAGTTVTEDILSGELAISRHKLSRVKDFFDRFFKKDE